ncbi:hypothetical protein CRE_20836 [Caenorhabditis remanei]|uniref:RNA helicase n=1 Tax=Caenorhabditis remanei TaxID=31234 RepID=E3MV24_CAERE|nr:hypothetical protein CRE_20836 [Caenorhabditis remanei]
MSNRMLMSSESGGVPASFFGRRRLQRSLYDSRPTEESPILRNDNPPSGEISMSFFGRLNFQRSVYENQPTEESPILRGSNLHSSRDGSNQYRTYDEYGRDNLRGEAPFIDFEMERNRDGRQGTSQLPEASNGSRADSCQYHKGNGAVTRRDGPDNTSVRSDNNYFRGNNLPEAANGISVHHPFQEYSPAYYGEALQQNRPQENEACHQNPTAQLRIARREHHPSHSADLNLPYRDENSHEGTSSTSQHPHIPGPSNSVVVTDESAQTSQNNDTINSNALNLTTPKNSRPVIVYPSYRNWEDEKRYSLYEVHNSNHVETMENWDSLHPQIRKNLSEFKILPNVPFQSKMIPQILSGNDVMGQANVSVGKSCATAISIVHKILTTDPTERQAAKNERSPLALILTPSATVVDELFNHHKFKIAKGTDVTVCKAYGGILRNDLELSLKEGCEILIGCNGRILDLLRNGRIQLSHLQFIVFEKTNCLIRQFLASLNSNLSGILRYLGFAAQRIYLDEEFSPEVEELIEAWSSSFYGRRGIVKVIPKPPQQRANVDLQFHEVHYGNKTVVLRELLKKEESGKQKRTVIFVNEDFECKELAEELSEDENLVLPVHYRQPDKTKQAVYEMFKMGNINTIVLTCAPFREYETVDIDQIIQYDAPSHHSTFVHRCGEFGNMNSGTVYVFVETCRPNFYCGEKKTFREHLDEMKKLALVPKWLKTLAAGNSISHDEPRSGSPEECMNECRDH